MRTRARVKSMMARLMTMLRLLWLMVEELQQPGEQQEVASAGSSWPGQS